MSRAILGCILAGSLVVGLPTAKAAVTVNVPGTSNPYLSGMPAGSTADGGDIAPDQSPVELDGVSSGEVFTFSATGAVNNGGGSGSEYGNGGPDGIQGFQVSPGDQNGMSGLNTPVDAVLGVFLDDNQPDGFSSPSDLDFSTTDEQNFQSLSPELRQVFFIGDGLDASNNVQQFIAPVGATRLFIGTADGYGWNDNSGSFDVTVTALPEPAGVWMLGVGCVSLLQRRRA
ncbi:MAG TPA: hypothetical protein VGG19_19735 [Tepidisphaeraceae bacterium]|jgi:hypothetical protein